MKHWIKIVLGFLTLSCNSQNKILTEREFTTIYLDSLKKAYPTIDFKIDNDLTIISHYQDKKFTHYLDNAFKEYKLQPDSISGIIKKYINSTTELFLKGKKEIQVNKIIPLIKPIDYLDHLRQLGKQYGKEQEPWIVCKHAVGYILQS